MFGSYVSQHYFCTRFREGKVTRTVRHGDGPGRKKKKNFRKSLAVQKNALPLRSRPERERQEKRSLREFSYRLK